MDLHRTSVTQVPGVGKKKAEDLHQLGIDTVADLLGYFPYRYNDFQVLDVSEAVHDEKVTFQGTVHGVPSIRWYGKKKSRLIVKVNVNGVYVNVVWYNQAYLKKKIKPGGNGFCRWEVGCPSVAIDRRSNMVW